MKKYIIVFAAISIMLFALNACVSESEDHTINQEMREKMSLTSNLDQDGDVLNYFSTLDILLEKDNNYEIYTDEAHSAFFYIVRDNQENIIDLGYHSNRGSFGLEAQSKLLVMEYGNGGNSWFERYYDVSNGNVSRYFERPVIHTDSMVAYFRFDEASNNIILVVQDVFDASRYYREIYRDFSAYVLKDQAEAVFGEDNTKIKISYWTNPDNEYVTEIIDL